MALLIIRPLSAHFPCFIRMHALSGNDGLAALDASLPGEVSKSRSHGSSNHYELVHTYTALPGPADVDSLITRRSGITNQWEQCVGEETKAWTSAKDRARVGYCRKLISTIFSLQDNHDELVITDEDAV